MTVNDAMPSEAQGLASRRGSWVSTGWHGRCAAGGHAARLQEPHAQAPRSLLALFSRTQSHISYEKAKERSTHIETFKRARTEAESENKRVSALSQWWQRHVKSRCAYITQARLDAAPTEGFWRVELDLEGVLGPPGFLSTSSSPS